MVATWILQPPIAGPAMLGSAKSDRFLGRCRCSIAPELDDHTEKADTPESINCQSDRFLYLFNQESDPKS